MIYAMWFGGSGYAAGDLEDDLERFDSIAAAGDALRDRSRNGGSFLQRFEFVNKEPYTVYTPCVENSRMEIYLALDTDENGRVLVHHNGPDQIIRLGPRGGIQTERFA